MSAKKRNTTTKVLGQEDYEAWEDEYEWNQNYSLQFIIYNCMISCIKGSLWKHNRLNHQPQTSLAAP